MYGDYHHSWDFLSTSIRGFEHCLFESGNVWYRMINHGNLWLLVFWLSLFILMFKKRGPNVAETQERFELACFCFIKNWFFVALTFSWRLLLVMFTVASVYGCVPLFISTSLSRCSSQSCCWSPTTSTCSHVSRSTSIKSHGFSC